MGGLEKVEYLLVMYGMNEILWAGGTRKQIEARKMKI